MKSASTENWIREELISPVSGECSSSKTPSNREKGDALKEGGARWTRRFAGLIASLCRRDCLDYTAILSPLSMKTFWFSEAAAHAPDGLERLITPSDELG